MPAMFAPLSAIWDHLAHRTKVVVPTAAGHKALAIWLSNQHPASVLICHLSLDHTIEAWHLTVPILLVTKLFLAPHMLRTYRSQGGLYLTLWLARENMRVMPRFRMVATGTPTGHTSLRQRLLSSKGKLQDFKVPWHSSGGRGE